MRKGFVLALLTMFCLVGFGLAAKQHRVELLVEGEVNGVVLEPGKYWVGLTDDGVLEFRQNGKLLATSQATEELRGDTYRNSVLTDKDGRISEIRRGKHMFVLDHSEWPNIPARTD
ncbi:MAG: hypothetical protein Kow00109_09560 [Acidobacteriota bacterium]